MLQVYLLTVIQGSIVRTTNFGFLQQLLQVKLFAFLFNKIKLPQPEGASHVTDTIAIASDEQTTRRSITMCWLGIAPSLIQHDVRVTLGTIGVYFMGPLIRNRYQSLENQTNTYQRIHAE